MRVPHSFPVLHFGEFDIDFKQLLIPLAFVIMVAVAAYLATSGGPEFSGAVFTDPNIAP